jgi:hypothetical protein
LNNREMLGGAGKVLMGANTGLKRNDEEELE